MRRMVCSNGRFARSLLLSNIVQEQCEAKGGQSFAPAPVLWAVSAIVSLIALTLGILGMPNSMHSFSALPMIHGAQGPTWTFERSACSQC